MEGEKLTDRERLEKLGDIFGALKCSFAEYNRVMEKKEPEMANDDRYFYG
jgi:hypothetical protein